VLKEKTFYHEESMKRMTCLKEKGIKNVPRAGMVFDLCEYKNDSSFRVR